jgi:hypothetical protein
MYVVDWYDFGSCEIVLLRLLVWLCVLCDSFHYLAVGERRSFRESAECSSSFRLDWLDNQVEEELFSLLEHFLLSSEHPHLLEHNSTDPLSHREQRHACSDICVSP